MNQQKRNRLVAAATVTVVLLLVVLVAIMIYQLVVIVQLNNRRNALMHEVAAFDRAIEDYENRIDDYGDLNNLYLLAVEYDIIK